MSGMSPRHVAILTSALLGLTPGLAHAAAPPGGHAAPAGRPHTAHSAVAYPLKAAPLASFVWFPALPHPGESVLLASTSSDPTSALVAFAWDLHESGFEASGPVTRTTFSTFAPHVVRLRVTDANHLSAVAAHTIQMSPPPVGVLRPFPIVRIDGIVKRNGMKVRLLSVEVGVGVRVTVRWRGRGCPQRSQRRTAASHKRPVVTIRFHRFERFLRAGVVLEIRASLPGEVGSYTRFRIRRHRLPHRLDRCLDPGGVRPIDCPTG